MQLSVILQDPHPAKIPGRAGQPSSNLYIINGARHVPKSSGVENISCCLHIAFEIARVLARAKPKRKIIGLAVLKSALV